MLLPFERFYIFLKDYARGGLSIWHEAFMRWACWNTYMKYVKQKSK